MTSSTASPGQSSPRQPGTPGGPSVPEGTDGPVDPVLPHAARSGTDQPGPVLPGSGWPGDSATAAIPVATHADSFRLLAAGAGSLAELTARQSVCRACPRLVGWREQVPVTRRRAFADQRYWGRPVPGWGDERPGVLIVGLAPAAHGGNRTGRIFTGDRSGDVLFESLSR